MDKMSRRSSESIWLGLQDQDSLPAWGSGEESVGPQSREDAGCTPGGSRDCWVAATVAVTRGSWQGVSRAEAQPRSSREPSNLGHLGTGTRASLQSVPCVDRR